jgi:1,4-dihydroxy-2-naphthoate octaprenyltransferase
MNTLGKLLIGAALGVMLALAVGLHSIWALIAGAAVCAAVVYAFSKSSRRYRAAGFAAFLCAVCVGASAVAGVVQYSTQNVIYLDSTGTNGCGFIGGNLVTKRGETYTTNQNLTLTYMSGANKTNSATFVNGVLTSTNTVNP